jgi:pescadillo protein
MVADDERPALTAALAAPDDESLIAAAELEAEAQGMAHAEFEAALGAARKAQRTSTKQATSTTAPAADEQPTASAMLTGKRRKLYEQLKRRQAAEQAETEAMVRKKRKALAKAVA